MCVFKLTTKRKVFELFGMHEIQNLLRINCTRLKVKSRPLSKETSNQKSRSLKFYVRMAKMRAGGFL